MYPLKKGTFAKQAPVGLPEGTYEEEHGRRGFYGKAAHLYHAHPPTGGMRFEGKLRPHCFDLHRLEASDQTDPCGSHVAFIGNDDIRLYVSQRSYGMPFYFRNADGDELPFVHRGAGTIETDFGPLNFQQGDYVARRRAALRGVPVPLFHRNTDYDKSRFYHDGDFFGGDNNNARLAAPQRRDVRHCTPCGSFMSNATREPAFRRRGQQLTTNGVVHNSSGVRAGDGQRLMPPNAAGLLASSRGERPAAQGVTVFVSYAHRDDRFRAELESHLACLKRQAAIDTWYDGRITPGSALAPEIFAQLRSAKIILLLISASFLASDFCYGVEMSEAMARHDVGAAVVIPIIVRPTDWHGGPFGKLLALPKDGKPVSTWPVRDLAYVDIVRGIRRAVEALRNREVAPTIDNES